MVKLQRVTSRRINKNSRKSTSRALPFAVLSSISSAFIDKWNQIELKSDLVVVFLVNKTQLN